MIKVAKLNRSQTIGEEFYNSGTTFQYIRKKKFFTTIKVDGTEKMVYTADLERFGKIHFPIKIIK